MPSHAVALEGDPQLDDVRAARALEAARPLVPLPRSLSSPVKEVRRALREGASRDRARRARAARRRRAAAASSCADPTRSSARGRFRAADRDACADSSADAPCAPSTCSQRPRSSQSVADRLEVVERAGRRRARRGDDGHHAFALRARSVSSVSASASVSMRQSRDGTTTTLRRPSPSSPTARATA